jgi:hypothetical protein
MHLAYVSYSAVLDVNRQLAYALAKKGVRVTVIAPDSVDSGAAQHRCEPGRAGIELVALPRRSGSQSLRFAGIERWFLRARPDAIIIEAGPGTLLVEQALAVAPLMGARVACTTCEVLERDFEARAFSWARASSTSSYADSTASSPTALFRRASFAR